ncbi:MAG TPA: hypothetical protein VMZ92_22040 [Planctomycetota bacterium]|nr:hypothetical protein [Planctomycetota bacterium]
MTTIVLAVVLGAAALAWCGVWHFRRSAAMVDKWAAKHDFGIVGKEARFFRQGPFVGHNYGGQMVFRVVVEDREGQVRKAYVRSGYFAIGRMSDRLTVAWDGAAEWIDDTC